MRNLTEENMTEAVLQQFEGCGDARLKEVMTSMVKHLHAFVRDVQPSEGEWLKAIEFLTATGKMCDDQRQEYILLSDTLGVSMLIDAINHRVPEGATESSVLGPFYVEGAPIMDSPADIVRDDVDGEPLLFSGCVTTPDGAPIEGALVDVWQTAGNGLYSNQDENQSKYNLRGKMLTDAEGRYAFKTAVPVSYEIPKDGPVGQLMEAMGRHCWRPAHVHFQVSAEGYEPVTTMVFTEGDPYLDSDAVFGVKGSLVVRLEKGGAGQPAEAHYDFGLKPAA